MQLAATHGRTVYIRPFNRIVHANNGFCRSALHVRSAVVPAAIALGNQALAPDSTNRAVRNESPPRRLPEPPPSSSLPHLLPWLLHLALSERQMYWRLFLSLLLMVASKAAGFTCPLFLKRAVDALGSSGGGVTTGVVQAAVLALLCYGLCDIARSIAKEAQGPTFTPVAQAIGRRVAYHTFAHVLELDIKFHLDRRTGRLSRILERGTRSLQLLYRTLVFTFMPTLLECALVCGVLGTTFHPIVAVLIGVAFVSYVAWTLSLTQVATKIRKEVNELDNQTTSKAVDVLLNYETVALFDNQKLEVQQYDSYLQGFQRASVRTEQLAAILNGGQAIILAVGLTSVLSAVVLLGAAKSAAPLAAGAATTAMLSAGDLVLVQGLMLQLWSPLQFLGWFYRELRSSIVDLEEFFAILRTRSNLVDGTESIPPLSTERASAYSLPLSNSRRTADGPTSSSGWDSSGLLHAAPASTSRAQIQGLHVELRDVQFGYTSDRKILDGVTLQVPPGQSLAIVGSSGSGKSTVLKLATRLYDVDSGQVLVNGADLRSLRLADLRQAVATVPQDTVLFNDTIMENIRYGRPAASDEEVIAAANLAHLDIAIGRMTDGFNTVVGERGLKLSGGEKQRVAIARAFLRAPRLLICDEATSSLDSATEAQIMASLQELARGRTSIFVAHRLSTVRNCDRIMVLRDGRVVEEGTHDQLMQSRGLYHAMWELQASEEGGPAKEQALVPHPQFGSVDGVLQSDTEMLVKLVA